MPHHTTGRPPVPRARERIWLPANVIDLRLARRRALLRECRAHRAGELACVNTIGASRGWSSPAGRAAERMASGSYLLTMDLEDLRGVWFAVEADAAASPAAELMIAHRVPRQSHRLALLPPESLAAVRAYLEERTALLARVRHELTHWPAAVLRVDTLRRRVERLVGAL